MNADTITETTRASTSVLDVSPDVATVSPGATSHKGRVPLFVPRAQAYYWSAEWQSTELESLREIEAGTVRRFTSGRAAAEWLLSDDSED